VIRIEKRIDTPKWVNFAIPIASVFMALVGGSVLLNSQGISSIDAYSRVIYAAFGGSYELSETIVRATPIAISSFAVMLCFTMLIWNIGVEGQAFMGALAATAAVRYCYFDNHLLMLLTAALFACISGGLWAMTAGYLKSKWNVNEILSTLMLNYIAIRILEYFVFGPWRDPSSLGFPITTRFPPSARLPQLFGTRVHAGIFLAMILSFATWYVLNKTRRGYEIKVIGENPKAARYSGINYMKNVLLVMFISGAIGGLAGMTEVTGLHGRLQASFSAKYGYTAIIVAWLSHLHPFVILLASLFFGALLIGGEALQVELGLTLSSVEILQGLVLFFVLGGDFFRNYRLRITWRTQKK
jgi:simple sugar transport system permease protein